MLQNVYLWVEEWVEKQRVEDARAGAAEVAEVVEERLSTR